MGMDLAGPGYHINRSNLLILESKADMQKRGHASPDDGDALALTFAAKPATSGVLAITALFTNSRVWSQIRGKWLNTARGDPPSRAGARPASWSSRFVASDTLGRPPTPQCKNDCGRSRSELTISNVNCGGRNVTL